MSPEPQLPTCTAHDLYFALGPYARAGVPMPDGTLPVVLPDADSDCKERIYGIHPASYESYLDLVAHTRSASPSLHQQD